MELEDEYYHHDAGCPAKRFTPMNSQRLRTCLDCAGIFDEKGNGVALLDNRLEERRTTARSQVYICPLCRSTKTIRANAAQTVAEFQQALPVEVLCGIDGCEGYAVKETE